VEPTISRSLMQKILESEIENRHELRKNAQIALQRNSDNLTLHFALSHNALARWRKVVASSSLEPLLHLKVIAL
jgi:hypothetical protein